MKVCISRFNKKDVLGGVEYKILSLSSKSNINFSVVTTSVNKRFHKKLLKNNIKFYIYPTFRILFLFKLFMLLLREKFNVLQVHDYFEGIVHSIYIIFFRRLYLIVRIHTLYKKDFKNKRIYFIKRIYPVINPLVFQFVCISNEIKQELIKINKFAKEKSIVLENGIPPIKNFLYPLSFNTVKIGIIGEVQPRKNQLFTLNLLKQIKEIDQIHVIGSLGSDNLYNKKFLEVVNENKKITFHGEKSFEERDKILYSVQYILLFSLFEGVPTCLLECLSCGKIPIFTKVGNVHRYIIHEHNGYLFPLKDLSVQVLQEIFTKSNSYNLTLSLNSKKSFRIKNTENYMIESFNDLYNNIC